MAISVQWIAERADQSVVTRMSVPPFAVSGGFGVLYLIALVVGRQTVVAEVDEPVVWPAAGVAAVWLVIRRESPTRWVDMAALAVLTPLGLIPTGVDPAAAVVHAGAAIAAAMTFAVVMARLLPTVWARGDTGRPLGGLDDLGRILVAAFLAGAVMACFDLLGDQLAGNDSSLTLFGIRLVRDVGSVLIFGVAVQRLAYIVRGGYWTPVSQPGALECVGVFVASAGAYYYTFVINHSLPIGFALLPITVWAAIRMPTAFGIAHTLVFACAAAVFTQHGLGPYAEIAAPDSRVLVIELYIAILALVGLALALSRDERDALIGRLRDSEEEATDKAELMTMIVNSMTEGLAILDHNGRLVLRNPAAGRLLGSVNTVAGGVALGSDYGFFHPDGAPLADADLPYARALAGEEVPPMDVLVRNAAVPEGRIVRFNVARIEHADTPQHVVVVFHDVTTDRRHRDELMSFAGRVAHDLLNPLTTIDGWAEVLEEELAGYRPAERVTRIQRAAARMRTFLNGLIAYTTARDGKLIPTTINLSLLLGDIVNSRLDQADSDGQAPPYFEIAQMEAIEGDPVLIRQLLENLIDNAVGPMPPGVTPYVSISCQPAANGMLRVDILDNGIGVLPGKRHEVFTSFHSERDERGNGLELAVCKRIVERHGGTIEAMANPYGSGTRMSFTLPAGRSAYARTLESGWTTKVPTR
jgi:signal transduction histidine kinase